MYPKEYYSELTEKIKSGEYFNDARTWYGVKYVYPIAQRNFFLAVMTISAAVTIVSLFLLASYFPLKVTSPLAVGISSKADYYSKLLPLAKPGEDPNEALIKYLLMNYITLREGYAYEALKRNLDFVKLYSDSPVFDVYKEYMKIGNPSSPVLRYKKHTKRYITVDSVSLTPREKQKSWAPGRWNATVKFTATESNALGIQESNWLAKVDAVMPDILFIKGDSKKEGRFADLEFKVTGYQLSNVGQ